MMKIAVAGGDLRMLTVSRLMREAGYESVELALDSRSDTDIFDEIKSCGAVILPLPCEKGGRLNAPMWNRQTDIGDVFSAGEGNTLFIGGRMPKNGDNYIDYSTREDFQIRNALPTAEGALAVAMRELSITLHGAKAVVTGYGRIGACLASMLRALNAIVTVAARRQESRALAEIHGINTVDYGDLAEAVRSADVVFNTVPAAVIGEKEISAMQRGTPIIDLASLPGGADGESAKRHGVKIIHATGLPGKTAPETAGRIIFDTATAILKERGIRA